MSRVLIGSMTMRMPAEAASAAANARLFRYAVRWRSRSSFAPISPAMTWMRVLPRLRAIAHQHPQLRRLLELLEDGHRAGGRIVPDVRPEALEHHGADRRAARGVGCDRLRDQVAGLRIAGPMVGDQRHVPDLHDEV